MAFPVIQSRTASNAAAASVSASYPATVNAGDTLLMFVAAKGASGTTTITTPTGWTLLDATPSGNQNTVGGVYYRKAAGTEGGTSITVATSTGVSIAVDIYRITGAADPTVNPPEHSTVATGFTNSATFGTLTPTGGSKDYLWLVFASSVGANFTAVPTGFGNGTNFANSTNAEGNVADMGATASSESPSAMSLSASTRWYAWTVAVYPTSGGGGVTVKQLAAIGVG